MTAHKPRTVFVTVPDSLRLDVGDTVVLGTGELARIETAEPDGYGRPFQQVTAITFASEAAA